MALQPGCVGLQPRRIGLLASSARLCDSAAASRLERAEVAEETTMSDLGRVRVRVEG